MLTTRTSVAFGAGQVVSCSNFLLLLKMARSARRVTPLGDRGSWSLFEMCVFVFVFVVHDGMVISVMMASRADVIRLDFVMVILAMFCCLGVNLSLYYSV